MAGVDQARFETMMKKVEEVLEKNDFLEGEIIKLHEDAWRSKKANLDLKRQLEESRKEVEDLRQRVVDSMSSGPKKPDESASNSAMFKDTTNT